MTRSILTALAVVLAAPAAAQTVPPQVAQLRESALKDDYAWDITEGLTTEVGQRLAGTEAEARARTWAVAKLRAMGFSNVRVETFDMPTWTRGAEGAEILAPFPQKLAVAALGNSASTGPGGLTGEVVGFDTLADLQAAPDEAVRGKIVFVSHAMPRTQDGSGYGYFGGPRRQGPGIASKKGAIAIVIRSIGTDYHRNPHTGVMSFPEGVNPIPAGALPLPDAEQLQRILKRGKPVTMHLTLVSQRGQGQSANVIADLPGRDPSLPPLALPLSCQLACQLRTPSQNNAASPCHQIRRDTGPIGLSMDENAGTRATTCSRDHCCSGPRRHPHNRLPMKERQASSP